MNVSFMAALRNSVMAHYNRVVRSWIPIPGSTKERLIRGALMSFGERGYDAVGVGELAARAEVTIGSLYHHFGSKSGIYSAVREDVERRALDRMEGAAAVTGPADLGAVLLVGFDYLVGAGFARLLSEPHPERDTDPIGAFLSRLADPDNPVVGRILLAAWRAALAAEESTAARTALRHVIGPGGGP
jgi:AcrR family transcriptional regulator